MCCSHWFWFSLLFLFLFSPTHLNPHTHIPIRSIRPTSSQYPSILFGLSHSLSLSVCFLFSFRVARLLFHSLFCVDLEHFHHSIHVWKWRCPPQLFRCFGSAWRYFIPKSPPATNASNCLCKEEVPTSIRWTLYRRAYRWLSISHSLYLSRSRYQLYFILNRSTTKFNHRNK
jgi:hypothetical protein